MNNLLEVIIDRANYTSPFLWRRGAMLHTQLKNQLFRGQEEGKIRGHTLQTRWMCRVGFWECVQCAPITRQSGDDEWG